MRAEAEALGDFKRVVEERWKTAKTRATQTTDSMEAVENAITTSRLLTLENEQVKRDIQALLDSYDAYKAEGQKTREEQAFEIQTLQRELQAQREADRREHERIVGHMNQELQAATGTKQQYE